MFKFIGNVLKQVWGEDEGDGVTVEKTKCRQEAGVDATHSEASSNLVQDQNLTVQTFTGYVTSVHSDYGLIDHQVYFALSLCKNCPVPKVGTRVLVSAERKHGGSGWCASSIVPVSKDDDENWDTDTTAAQIPQDAGAAASQPIPQQVSCNAEDLVAVVTAVSNNVVFLNENIRYDLSSVTNDYIPSKGDWVTARTRLDTASGERHVLDVQPLRVWDYEGEVNSVQPGFGYINSEIYFQIDACADGYKPRRHDRVRGRAVECSRGRSPWRAIQVIPIQDMPRSSGVPQSPRLQTITSTLLANKENVKISESLQFGEVQNGESKNTKAFIRNESSETQTLIGCRFCGDDQGQFLVDKMDFVPPNKSLECDLPVVIPPNKMVAVQLICNARNLGADQKLIVFEFKTFKIGRYVSVNVRDSSYKDYLQPNTPYQRSSAISSYQNTQQADAKDGWLVPGQRPSRSKLAIKLPNRMPQFVVPPLLEAAYHGGDSLVFVAPTLGEDLCMDNYTERFSALIHLEEIQEEIDIRLFDLERVGLRQVGEFLALGVPGLSEGRPSVLVGDSVILSAPGLYDNQPDYQGYVHEVLSTEVLLKFHAEFHNKYGGEDYNVRFTLNRTTARRCHQAVTFAPSLAHEVLFPTKLIPKVPQTKVAQNAQSLGLVADVVKVSPVCGVKRGPLRRPASQTSKHEFFNPCLNARQKSAVLRILSGQARPTPYILFGPPGTGKTVTLVEALLQVLTNVPASRVIACTPSNSAADLLCQRLHASGKVKSSDMVRLNSYSRSEDSIPAEILSYCKTGDDLELVSRHRLVISTCMSAGMMFTLGLRAGHFTHVFIDEAGQATEPEAMIPMGLVAGTDGQVVLAGDPRQLGPVLQSQEAKDYGLGQSLLERLINSPLYIRNEKKFADHGSYDPLLVTKLVENYRSHEALLKLPSVLFYHNELLPSADTAMTGSLTHWDQLPNRDNFPLIFHGIRGEDMREGNSPSWFNPMEVLQVMRYLQSLNTSLSTALTFDDIGIITPYRKQVEKIRLLVDKLGMDKVKVGSVEEFQGQERLVMIISTVRSNEGHVRSDIRHNLGFLSNPKRFNVSISRAQALMIVIGNPHVLSQDENWKILIKYSVENGAYVGCDLPDLSLNQDVDLQPCKRLPSSVHAEPTTVSTDAASIPAHGGGDNVTKKLESELIEAGVEAAYSESDGDDTLSVHSADTEISVKLMRPKITPEPTQPQTAEELQGLPQHQTRSELTPQCDKPLAGGCIADVDDNTKKDIPLSDKLTLTSEQHKENEDDTTKDIVQEPCTQKYTVDASQHSGTYQHSTDIEQTTTSTLDEDVPNTSQQVTDPTLPTANNEEPSTDVTKPGGVHVDDTIEKDLLIPLSDKLVLTSEQHEENTDDTTKDSVQEPCTQTYTVDALQHSSPCTDLHSTDIEQTRSTLDEPAAAGGLPNTSEHITDPTLPIPHNEEPSTDVTKPGGVPVDDTTERPILVPDKLTLTSEQHEEKGEHVTDPTLPKAHKEEHNTDVTKAVCVQEDTPNSEVHSVSTQQKTSSVHSHTPRSNHKLSSAQPERAFIADTSWSPPVRTQGRRARKNTAERLILSLDNSRTCLDAGKRCSISSSVSSCDSLQNEDASVTSDCSDRDEKLNTSHLQYPNDTQVDKNKNTSDIKSSSVKDRDLVLVQRMPSDDAKPDSTQSSIEPDSLVCRDASGEPSHVADMNGNSGDAMLTTADRPQYPADDNCSHVVTELDKKIIRQVEYYFGTFNLSKDTFMQGLLVEDSGWITLDMLITFKRLRALSTDFTVITTALNKSTSGLLEVDTVLHRVRRSLNHPLPEDNEQWKSTLKYRSTFIIGLKRDNSAEELKCHFEKWGTVEHVHMLKPQRRHKGETVVVTYPFVIVYQKPSEAGALVAMKNGVCYKSSQLYAHFRDDIITMLYGVPPQSRGRNNHNRNVPDTYSDLKSANHQLRGHGVGLGGHVPHSHPSARESHFENQSISSNDDTHRQGPGQRPSHSPHQRASLPSAPDGLLPLPDDFLPITQPQGVVSQGVVGQGWRGRGRAFLRRDTEPSVGWKPQQTVSSPSLGGVPAWPPSSPLPTTIAAIPSPGWQGRGRGRGLLNGSPSTPSTSVSNTTVSNTTVSNTSVSNTSVESARDDSLEQDDSDVIIESSEEEFLEA